MSGSFDPLSGRPTGSVATGASRGEVLPTGTSHRDQRNSARGRGRWVMVLGLVLGLGLVAVGLIPHGDNGSPAQATAAATTTVTTTVTTTTTAAPTTTTTTELTTEHGFKTVTATTPTGRLEYDVPDGWTSVDRYELAGKPADYATLTGATEDFSDVCSYQPSGAGLYTDDTEGPNPTTATQYARGLANIAFGSVARNPDTTVVSVTREHGTGWEGYEVVVSATLTDPLDCGLHKGMVVLTALTTTDQPDQPDQTVMLAAFGGLDGGGNTTEAKLHTIAESARIPTE